MAITLRKGTPITDVTTGAPLGRVNALYLDPTRGEIAGFSLRQGRGLWRGRPGLVDLAAIRRCDGERVEVNTQVPFGSWSRASERAGWIDLDRLIRRPVVLEAGPTIGRIVAIRLDLTSRRMCGLEVEPFGRYLCRMLIDTGQIVRIADDAVIIRERPLAPAQLPPLPAALPGHERGQSPLTAAPRRQTPAASTRRHLPGVAA